MFSASNLQLDPSKIDPPNNEDDFDIFCLALFRKFCLDPGAQRVGRRGQAQNGVDVYGRYKEGIDYWGLQNKKVDQRLGKLEKKDIHESVGKAKGFTPKLKRYFIFTTLPRDESLQILAREITKKNQAERLFSVDIWFWEDIRELLLEHRDILYMYWPHLRPGSETVNDHRINEIKRNTEKILEGQSTKLGPNIAYGHGTVNVTVRSDSGLFLSDKSDVVHTKLDSVRDQIDNNPISALKDLEKIKKDHWSTADNILKFRIITNIAVAESKIGEEEDAAKHFIEALQYNPKDEKALCNAATGYLIQENKSEAARLVQKVLELNPASDRGYSLKIYSSGKNISIEEITKNIPKANLGSAIVTHAIGYVLRLRGEYKDAVRWFRQAVEKDPDDVEKSASLAETLLQTIIENQTFIYGEQLTASVKQDLEEVDGLLKNAWDHISDKEIKKFRTSWLANRSLANRFLNNYDIAFRTVDEALEIKPKDPNLIKQKAVLLFETGKKEEAVVLLKTIEGFDSQPEISIPLAALLRGAGYINEAIDLLKTLKNNTGNQIAIHESNRMLIDLLISADKIDEAKELSERLIQEEPDNISYLVDRAHLYFALKDNESAELYLEKAKRNINTDTSYRQLIELANAFYVMEKFNDASDVLEKVADTNSDSELTRKLLNSYYRAGRLAEALGVTKNLSNSQGSTKYITELESSIYEEIGDWNQAKGVCSAYLEKNPKDVDVQIRYAAALLRSGSKADLEELDKFLNSEVNTSNLSFNFWIQLISLYEVRGYSDKALADSYEVRRKFFNEAEAHLQYIGIFFRTEKTNESSFNRKEVKIDTAVCIGDKETPGGQWYILEERQNSDLNRGELNKDHTLFDLLIGKKIGDSIIVKNSGPIPEQVIVKELKHKYVYALHDSLNNFSSRFPTAEGLWGIKVPISEQSSDKSPDVKPPQSLQIILDQVTKQDNFIHQIEQFYKEGKLTLGAFAMLIGKDVLTIWGGVISPRGPGLKSSNGTLEERRESILALRVSSKSKLVIDPISLMTIHGVGLAESIVNYFGKPTIAASTVELIRENIANKRGLGSRGYMTISKEGDKFVRDEVTQEQIQKNIEYLESIVRWVEEKCDVVPCTPALEIQRDLRIKNEKILGKESYETILLAAQPGHMLYSDDERLRSLAKHEHGCVGIWTQLLMMEMLEKKSITQEVYAQAVLKLINSNYHHTNISKAVLLEAIKRSSWKIEEPFTGILNKLKEGQSDLRSSIAVASEFIEGIWDKIDTELSQDHKTKITKHVVGVLIENRSVTEVIERFKREFERLFINNPVNRENVLSAVRAWVKEKGANFEV